MLLGHAHPAVVEAVRRRAGLGSNFAYVTEPALELAEELARAVPCAERVRFCASGTEATSYAVRLARAYTGRPKVLKFEGAYHGGNDIGTVSLFPSRLVDFPKGEPTSAGLAPGAVADILGAPPRHAKSTGKGKYTVTGLVGFLEAPGTGRPTSVNRIGKVSDARAGLAVLRIAYSNADGSGAGTGILVVSCHLPVGSPHEIFEGVIAAKGYVMYFSHAPAMPGVDANRTIFHRQ